MKTATVMVAALSFMLFIGCKTSPRGGGVSQDEGFKIVVPGLTVKVKQGEIKTVNLSLNRGEFFKRDVTLAISSTQGITVDPASVTIKASEKPEVQVRIEASKDAPLGEYRVYVKGTPETGEPATIDFQVKVVAP